MSRLKMLIISTVLLTTYLFTRLVSLGNLPVFADEAIYIRWAQLILDDSSRYLFFSLNDGKTPLFIWTLIPFLKTISDPLLAGRLVSVVVGLLQVGVMAGLVKVLGGGRRAQVVGAGLVVLLPFWVFSHRLALMDAMLTLWLSTVVLIAISLVNRPIPKVKWNWSRFLGTSIVDFFQQLPIILLGGLFLGLAFWTKLPAVLLIPALFSFTLLPSASWWQRAVFAVRISGIVGLGIVLFFLLKLHPAFGQLFHRGEDFLFPISDILAGGWQQTIRNFPTYLQYFSSYLTPAALTITAAGAMFPKYRRQVLVLLLAFAAFTLPVGIMGKVVYARYLLPGALFLTAATAFGIETILTRLQSNTTLHFRKLALSVALALLLANTVGVSANFLYFTLTNPNQLPLVQSDQTQYLTEWSSGHGIRETVALIEDRSKTTRLAVATEGFFGTLPDALLMYFHSKDVSNLYIEGIGQPVAGIPAFFQENAREYDEVWLVVNSHRLTLALPREQLIAEFCRPLNAPCLQVWDITQILSPSQQ